MVAADTDSVTVETFSRKQDSAFKVWIKLKTIELLSECVQHSSQMLESIRVLLEETNQIASNRLGRLNETILIFSYSISITIHNVNFTFFRPAFAIQILPYKFKAKSLRQI